MLPKFSYAMNPLRTVAAMVLFCAASLTWADRALEQAVAAKDPKALAQALREGDTAEPLLLMQAAMGLLEVGQRDKAVFWFNAGQLRARYSPQLQGENAQLLTIFLMTIGEQVNAAAFRDIPALVRTLDEVIAWDERTFARWAAAMKLDAKDPALLERRRKAVEGIEPYKKELLAKRETLEAYARDFKTPAQLATEQQEKVNREYSREPVELNVAGTNFRVPADYLWPHRLNLKPGQRLHDMGFWVFLPDFGGFTKENWREPGRNPDAILIRVQGDKAGNAASQLEAFLADGDAPKEKVDGWDATVYDERKTRAPLPMFNPSRQYVIKGAKARGGDYYVICDAPEPGMIRSTYRCQMFLGNRTRDLRIAASFDRKHLVRMATIEERLSAMLDSWTMR